MKLHLPKMLLAALIAALGSLSAWADDTTWTFSTGTDGAGNAGGIKGIIFELSGNARMAAQGDGTMPATLTLDSITLWSRTSGTNIAQGCVYLTDSSNTIIAISELADAAANGASVTYTFAQTASLAHAGSENQNCLDLTSGSSYKLFYLSGDAATISAYDKAYIGNTLTGLFENDIAFRTFQSAGGTSTNTALCGTLTDLNSTSSYAWGPQMQIVTHGEYVPVIELVWNGTAEGYVWNNEATNKNWLSGTDASAFTEGSNVSFGASGAHTTVLISEEIQAGSITVTGSNYTFEFGEGGYVGGGDVKLSGHTLNLTGEGAMEIADLKGGGILNISGDTLMNGDSAIVATGEELTVAGDGSFMFSSVSSAGKVSISSYMLVDTLTVTAGTVEVNGLSGSVYKSVISNMVSNEGASISLTNASASIAGAEQGFQSNLSIGEGATVTVSGNDKMAYGVTNTITVLEGGEMTFSNARFTMGSGNKIVMAGGSITGTGDGDNGALDYYRAGSMSATKASSASTISAPIRLRGVNVAVEVESEAELTLSGKLNESQGKGSLTKTGEGTLTLAGANVYTGGTTINAGAVKVTNATGLGNGNVVLTNGSLQVSAAVNLSSVTLSQTGGSITVDAGNSLTLGSGSLSSAIAADGTVSFTGGIALADAMKEETVAAGHINEFGNADKNNGFVQGSSKYVALVTKGESAVVTVGDSATFTYKSKNYTKDNVDADSGRLIVEAAAATDWTLFEISSGNHKLSDIQKEAGKHDSAKIATVEIAGGTLNVDSTDLGAGEIKATGGSVTLGQAVGTVTVGAASDLTLSGAGVISSVAVEDTATIGGVFNASAFSVVAGKTATVNDAASLGSLAVDGTLTLQGAAKATDGTVNTLTAGNASSLTTTGNLALTTASGGGSLDIGGSLTLGGAVSLTGVKAGSVVLETGSTLTLTGALDSAAVQLATVSTGSSYVTADSLAATAVNFTVDDTMVAGLNLAEGDTVTLAKLTQAYTGTLTVNNGANVYISGDQLCYAISRDTETNNIILTAQAVKGDYVWDDDSGDNNWGTAANWAGNKLPDETSWVQVDKSATINMDEDGQADRLTIYKDADVSIEGGNALDVTSILEVNDGGILALTEEVAANAPQANVQGMLKLQDQATLTTEALDLAAKDGSTSGILSVESGAGVATGVLTGDADSTLEGFGTVTITGKGTRYQGKYAGATVAVAKGGDAVLYAGEDLNLAGAGSAQLVYTQDTAISSIQADGLTLTLNNAAADNSGVTLALEAGSSLKNGKILTGLSAVGTAATIDSADAPHMVSTAGASLKRSMAAPGLDLTGSTVVLTQSEGCDVTQMVVNNGGKTKGLVLAYLGGDNTNAAVQLNGNLFAKYYKNARLQGGSILVDMNDTYYQGLVRPTTANGRAGAAMLDDAFVYVNPQQIRPDSDLAKLMDALESGAVPASAADSVAAAVSGASAAAMGAAFGADVERQLRAIRNRTTSMGCAECVVNEEMPYVNAWVNAEGDYRKLDADSTLAGYKMSSWGATLGVDLDFTNRFTAGLAVTAMQGDFTADSAETATGDLDRLYLSAFARYSRRAWTHTFVGTFGKADANLKRTVDYGTGTYSTKGDLSGTAFGLMYEVGYTKALTEDASVCLQPVFNISYRHSSLGSYTETGSDAALRMGDMEMDTVTFGLGARMQGTIGTSVYNRTSVVELRALAKLDAGDRDCAAKAGMAGLPAAAREVQSAEYGAFGVEVGAGLLVPLGEYGGTLFCDAAAELRSGYTNVNGTVGYRFNF